MPLRPLTAQDLPLVRAWRNAPVVRRNMYSQHEITEAEHQEWFTRLKDDMQSRWFIHEDALGQPNGVVYFTQIQPSNCSSFWGFYTTPDALPGVGTLMGVEALDKAFLDLGLHKLNAEVIAYNESSLRFQKKLGFIEEGRFRDFHYDGENFVDVVRLGLLATEWESKREVIQARITKLDKFVNKTNAAEKSQLVEDKSYIVASCKLWHESGFERLKSDVKGNWQWVSTQEQLLHALENCTPKYIFFLHWNWIVSDDVWKNYECICFHMTDVPYGRGGSPLQNLIVADHKETKLTALRMVKEMDAGPVYIKRNLSLAGSAESIYRRAGELSFDVIRWIIENKPLPTPQQGEIVLFKRRQPAQSNFPNDGTLENLYDHIRMLDAPSYPLAFIDHGVYNLVFSNAQIHGEEVIATVKIRVNN